MADIKLDILTPLGPKREGIDVAGVEVPGIEGELGLLPHHEALITAILPGVVRFKEGAQSVRIAVGAGFLEIKEAGRVVILVERALSEDEVDVDAARTEAAEAKKALDAFGGKIGSAEHSSLADAWKWADAQVRCAQG